MGSGFEHPEHQLPRTASRSSRAGRREKSGSYGENWGKCGMSGAAQQLSNAPTSSVSALVAAMISRANGLMMCPLGHIIRGGHILFRCGFKIPHLSQGRCGATWGRVSDPVRLALHVVRSAATARRRTGRAARRAGRAEKQSNGPLNPNYICIYRYRSYSV